MAQSIKNIPEEELLVWIVVPGCNNNIKQEQKQKQKTENTTVKSHYKMLKWNHQYFWGKNKLFKIFKFQSSYEYNGWKIIPYFLVFTCKTAII